MTTLAAPGNRYWYHSRFTKSHKICAACTVTGLLLVIAGCVSMRVLPRLVREAMAEQLPLKEGSRTYSVWQKPPESAPIHFQIWLFDLVNPTEVLQHGEKPTVMQKGPYTYRWGLLETAYFTSKPILLTKNIDKKSQK